MSDHLFEDGFVICIFGEFFVKFVSIDVCTGFHSIDKKVESSQLNKRSSINMIVNQTFVDQMNFSTMLHKSRTEDFQVFFEDFLCFVSFLCCVLIHTSCDHVGKEFDTICCHKIFHTRRNQFKKLVEKFLA